MYPPLASSINDAVTRDQPTPPTHEVSRTKLLDNDWIWVSAVRTDETDREVRGKRSLLRLRRRGKGKRFWVSHYEDEMGYSRVWRTGDERKGKGESELDGILISWRFLIIGNRLTDFVSQLIPTLTQVN